MYRLVLLINYTGFKNENDTLRKIHVKEIVFLENIQIDEI